MEVQVYTKTDCPFCVQTKQWFKVVANNSHKQLNHSGGKFDPTSEIRRLAENSAVSTSQPKITTLSSKLPSIGFRLTSKKCSTRTTAQAMAAAKSPKITQINQAILNNEALMTFFTSMNLFTSASS